MKLVKADNPVLKTKARKVVVFDSGLRSVVAELISTMIKEKGIGIAAPQVGLNKSVIIVDIGGAALPMINPTITWTSEETCKLYEGCLSFPGVRRLIERPKWCEVSFCNVKGKRMKVRPNNPGVCRIILHETDHCEGLTMMDYPEAEPDKT